MSKITVLEQINTDFSCSEGYQLYYKSFQILCSHSGPLSHSTDNVFKVNVQVTEK